MGYVLYTNTLGVFLYNDKGELAASRGFSDKERQEYEPLLRRGEWIKPEEELLKGTDGRVIFLGFKKAKRENIVLSQDVDKLARFTAVRDREKFRAANQAISANDVRLSFSEDIVVMHTIRTIDELEHVTNAMLMRVMDFVKLYAPEAVSYLDEPSAVLGILEKGAASTIGYPISEEHKRVFQELARGLAALNREKEKLEKHVEATMKRICPNLLGVAGALLGARLIALAGSLKQLATMPYTTVQLLGAEQALFRHIKKGSKCPKHGIILAHPFVQTAKSRGKAARLLAEKLSHAARLDYFKGPDMSEKLLRDMEARLK